VAAGSPAAVKKVLDGGSQEWIEKSAGHYVKLAAKYRDAGLGHEMELDGKADGTAG
jgi:carbonic anhydrase/acetyltransferase-like protein (isoleucine patch superfamily)